MLPIPILLLLASGSTHAWIDDAGDLVVVGDGGDNRINISHAGCETPEPPSTPEGGFQIWSNESTINDMPGSPGVVLVPFGKTIRVYLEGGNDRLRIDCTVPLDVAFYGGDGNDAFSSGLANVEGDVVVDGGPGDDVVDFQDALFRGRFEVRDVKIANFYFGTVLGEVRVEGDLVFGARTLFNSSVEIAADEVMLFGDLLHDDYRGGLTITANRALVVGLDVARDLRIEGSSLARVVGVDVGQSLAVALGPGADLLHLDMVSIGKESRVDGGRGLDALLRGQVVGAPLHVVGFEAVPRLRR